MTEFWRGQSNVAAEGSHVQTMIAGILDRYKEIFICCCSVRPVLL
jgi:hypothetical protein